MSAIKNVMVKKKLPYERNPIPEDNKPLKFETETIPSRITFGISIGLGVFSFPGCDRHLAISEPIPYIFI